MLDTAQKLELAFAAATLFAIAMADDELSTSNTRQITVAFWRAFRGATLKGSDRGRISLIYWIVTFKNRESRIDHLTNGQGPLVAMRAHGKSQDFAVDSACQIEGEIVRGRTRRNQR